VRWGRKKGVEGGGVGGGGGGGGWRGGIGGVRVLEIERWGGGEGTVGKRGGGRGRGNRIVRRGGVMGGTSWDAGECKVGG